MSSNDLDWNSPLEELNPRGKKTLKKLSDKGISTLYDFLWILPLRHIKIPPAQNFSQIEVGNIFKGRGEILNVRSKRNFRARGKGRVPLQNIDVVVKDFYGPETLNLKWFNSYPSVYKKLKTLKTLEFWGEIQVFAGRHQIVNPDYKEISEKNTSSEDEMKLQYPTVCGVSGNLIQKYLKQIPENLWSNIPETLDPSLLEKRKLFNLQKSFQILHGFFPETSKEEFKKAERRLIYQEFFEEQGQLLLRRDKKKSSPGVSIHSQKAPQDFEKLFPYTLTKDQKKSVKEIFHEFEKGQCMMRLLQGDVGSGKTTVALMAALKVIDSHHQVALMCPTESLAHQHFQTCQKTLPKEISFEILLGSTPAKKKTEIYKKLKEGEISFIIGTHSLIQKKVEFKSLGLAIIDEQHKFGVNQRITLTEKGQGVHCLIMTATPIPRSLSLTQYGDLDISLIQSLPEGRKGIKTRIVTPQNLNKFLSFIKTRISLDEQVYIVVPAITENEISEIQNLETVLEKFKKIFKDEKVSGLHGQMKSEEKKEALDSFSRGEIDILISTSVIEVGIDVPKASTIGILNPERFGLSSLHQLRGRVGRGTKAGFCFLVCDKNLSPEVHQRLSVIESSQDGFKIAEEDLKIRGEGNILGVEQSGSEIPRKIANIVRDHEILYQAREDAQIMLKNRTLKKPALLESKQKWVHSTI